LHIFSNSKETRFVCLFFSKLLKKAKKPPVSFILFPFGKAAASSLFPHPEQSYASVEAGEEDGVEAQQTQLTWDGLAVHVAYTHLCSQDRDHYSDVEVVFTLHRVYVLLEQFGVARDAHPFVLRVMRFHFEQVQCEEEVLLDNMRAYFHEEYEQGRPVSVLRSAFVHLSRWWAHTNRGQLRVMAELLTHELLCWEREHASRVVVSLPVSAADLALLPPSSPERQEELRVQILEALAVLGIYPDADGELDVQETLHILGGI
jgi:hypothetical protein